MASGERNTRFYNVSTIACRKHNRIELLKLDNGDWCSDNQFLKLHARSYFCNLFGLPESAIVPLQTNPMTRLFLHQEDQAFLMHLVQFWETTKALKSIQPYKAFGPNGY